MPQGKPNPNQHTREWWHARRGKLSASRIARVVHATMKGWSTFMDELEQELQLDDVPERFPNGVPKAIQHGWDQEPLARANYEFEALHEVQCPAFIVHPDIAQLGASSDFLVPEKRINGEIKAPYNQSNHRRIVMQRTIPQTYFPQVQCQMWCHGYELTHFVSYDPRYPNWRERTVIVVVNRDNSYIQRMGDKVTDFLYLFNSGRRPADVGKKQIVSTKFF